MRPLERGYARLPREVTSHRAVAASFYPTEEVCIGYASPFFQCFLPSAVYLPSRPPLMLFVCLHDRKRFLCAIPSAIVRKKIREGADMRRYESTYLYSSLNRRRARDQREGFALVLGLRAAPLPDFAGLSTSRTRQCDRQTSGLRRRHGPHRHRWLQRKGAGCAPEGVLSSPPAPHPHSRREPGRVARAAPSQSARVGHRAWPLEFTSGSKDGVLARSHPFRNFGSECAPCPLAPGSQLETRQTLDYQPRSEASPTKTA